MPPPHRESPSRLMDQSNSIFTSPRIAGRKEGTDGPSRAETTPDRSGFRAISGGYPMPSRSGDGNAPVSLASEDRVTGAGTLHAVQCCRDESVTDFPEPISRKGWLP